MVGMGCRSREVDEESSTRVRSTLKSKHQAQWARLLLVSLSILLIKISVRLLVYIFSVAFVIFDALFILLLVSSLIIMLFSKILSIFWFKVSRFTTSSVYQWSNFVTIKLFSRTIFRLVFYCGILNPILVYLSVFVYWIFFYLFFFLRLVERSGPFFRNICRLVFFWLIVEWMVWLYSLKAFLSSSSKFLEIPSSFMHPIISLRVEWKRCVWPFISFLYTFIFSSEMVRYLWQYFWVFHRKIIALWEVFWCILFIYHRLFWLVHILKIWLLRLGLVFYRLKICGIVLCVLDMLVLVFYRGLVR